MWTSPKLFSAAGPWSVSLRRSPRLPTRLKDENTSSLLFALLQSCIFFGGHSSTKWPPPPSVSKSVGLIANLHLIDAYIIPCFMSVTHWQLTFVVLLNWDAFDQLSHRNMHLCIFCISVAWATENAGTWKCRTWKMTEQIAGLENTRPNHLSCSYM